MSAPEDHDVLDTIAIALDRCGDIEVRRASECVEFCDLQTGEWFEIVVRQIDLPSEE